MVFPSRSRLAPSVLRVLRSGDGIRFLSLQEIEDVARTLQLDHEIVERRRYEYESYRSLVPPRVLITTGEDVNRKYRRSGIPDEALAGAPV